MPRLILLIAVLFLGCHPEVAPAKGVREIPVTYRSEMPLAASLLLPEATGPVPAVVIVQGSGSVDRTNAWSRAVADVMVEAGFAVLLTDKRGSGQSGGDWRTAGFEELAEDALAGVGFLKVRSEIDGSRIGIVGLSQGGRVIPVAAARSRDVAFVVNIVGDAVSFAEQSMHEMANVARQMELGEHRDAILALNAALGRGLLSGDLSEYAEMRNAALQSPWAKLAQGFPAADSPVLTFFRKVMTFDPMPYWIMVRQPTLVLYGAEDEQDNVAVEESVRRLQFGFRNAGKTNYRIAVLPGLGHDLGWRNGGGKLAPAAADTLANWLRTNVLVPQAE